MVIVAIVGMDGSGKTTQAKMLVEMLNRADYSALYVRPVYVLSHILTRYGSKKVNSISPRTISTSSVKDSCKNKWSISVKKVFMGVSGYPYAMITYFYMKNNIGRNKILVCDRYFYQFFFDVFGKWTKSIIRLFPRPDITFFLDSDLDTFYSRMVDSNDQSVSRDYYTDVLDLYREVSKRYGFVQIDAKLEKEVINEMIFGHLTEMLGGRSNE
ncbi:MAG: hypothetical protein SVO01_01785 [Thermotogota bacterium]|nr:hypothetical protein [Thermotogota bacterium]